MQAKIRNGLIAALTFVMVLTLVLTCAFSLNESKVAQADTVLETTYLTGLRSSAGTTIRIYWRIDGENLGYTNNQVLATPTVAYTSGSETSNVAISLCYTTASTQGINASIGNTSDRRKGDVASNHPCLYFLIDGVTPASGDSFVIPAGTALDNADGVDTYVLDQDYKFVYTDKWLFADDTEIPVTMYGYRSGSASSLYVFGGKNLTNYYVADIQLAKNITIGYIPAGGTETTKTITEIKPEIVSAGSVASKEAFLINLGFSANVGDVVILKKGTKLDNFALDRDYRFTYIDTSKWAMEGVANEDDPVMTLTKRGGDTTTLNLFTTSALPFANTEQFAINTVVYVKGEPVHTSYFQGVSQSGNNYSFGIRLPSAVSSGDIVKLPKNMVIAGYRLDKDYYFQYTFTTAHTWTLIECDGTNHIYNDDFTCHDRTCACGHVSEATTEHKYAEGDEVCEERNCTDCGEAATPAEHTFEANTYDCQDRSCTVCSNLIEATEDHTPDSDACDAKCTKCQQSFASHSFPEAPQEGWTVVSAEVTVTTQPDCTETGLGTVKCANCPVTEEVVVNALGHNVPNGGTHCDRTGCDYRIPFTAADMEEILALESLVKYAYGDSHVVDDGSILGTIRRTEDNAYDNNFLINSSRVGETPEGKGIFAYDEGKDAVHNMMFSFSVNLSAYAQNYRSSYVWMMGHENGSWGIGFMFCFYETGQNLRVQYKSTDGKEVNVVPAATLTGFALNEVQTFDLGVVQNGDGTFFIFAYYNDELLFTGTLTSEQLKTYANEATHDGLGGAIGLTFNGSASAPSPVGIICNKTHVYEGTQYVCKDYSCEICGTIKAHTAEHSWGEALKTGEGDCDTKEEFTRTCTTCSDITKFEGDYVHEWDTENPIEVSPAQCNNVNQVVKYGCKHCEEESQNQEVAGSGIEGTHEYDFVVVTPSTCSQPGSGHDVCTKCGDEATLEEVPVDPTAHAYGTEVAEVAPSCGVVGTAAHYECEYCNKLFTKDGEVYTEVQAADLVIPASCTKVLVSEVPATCTTNGVREHYECSVCGKLYLRSEHLYTPVDAEDLVIEAGHKYVNGICSVCQERDEVYFFNQAISAVTSATSAEAKFEKLSAAIAQFNLLTAEEKTANASALDAQIDAYNALVASANAAHNAQSDLLANILKLLAQITALTSAAAVGLFLSKLNA